MIKRIKKSLVPLLLVLVISLGLIATILISSTKGNSAEGETFAPVPAQTSESYEIKQDLPVDFTVDITSDKQITQANLSDFVQVTDSGEDAVPVRIKQHSGYYTILPPENNYEEGEYYTVKLNNAKFREENISDCEELVFATGKDDVQDVRTKADVYTVAEQKVIFASDDTVELIKDQGHEYAVGDFLFLPDPEDGLGEVAYKIESIEADNGDVISLGVKRPPLNEVYEKVEIYGAQTPNPEDVQFYSEEEIIESVLNTDTVRSIGYAVDVLNGNIEPPKSSAGFDWNVSITTPKVKLKISNVKLNPVQFDVSISIGWSIKDFLDVTLTGSFSEKVENFTNIDDENNIYATGTRTTEEFSVSIGISYSQSTDFSKLQKWQMLKFFNATKTVLHPLKWDPAWAVQSLDSLQNGDKTYTDLIDGREKHVIAEGSTIQNFIRGKSSEKSNSGSYIKGTTEAKEQVREALVNLVNCYQAGKSNMNSDLIPLVNIPIPLPYGCSIHIRLGIVFSVNFEAAFESTFKVSSVNEQTNVTTDNGTQKYENRKTTVSLANTLRGSLEVRIGFGLEVKVTLAKIFYVSVQAEAGEYFEITGFGGMLIGDPEGAEMFTAYDESGATIGGAATYFGGNLAFVGYLSFDCGVYASVTLKAGLSIDLILIKIDISVSFTEDVKKSIFDGGVDDPKVYSDLIFEDQLKGKFKNEIASGQTFKDDIEFGEKYNEFYNDNGGAEIDLEYDQYFAKLPQVLRRTINLETREVWYEVIPYERLHFDLDEGTYIDAAGTIMQRDRSNPAIDDLVWITAEDREGKLYSLDEFNYVRITKDPIPVDAVSIYAATEQIYESSENYVFTEFNPECASYKDMNFEVVEVAHNGQIVSADAIEKYAYFDDTMSGERGKLITTAAVSVGDTITIKGTAKHDNVESNLFTFNIVRRPVESISFVTQNRQTTVSVGQELPFEVLVYPLNATFNREGGKVQIEVSNQNLATVAETDGRLSLKVTDDYNAFGKSITLKFTVDDDGSIVELDYTMMIIQVPIDLLKIKDANLNELGEITSLNRGQSMDLVAVAEPSDATVLQQIQILKSVNNQYVTLDDSGKLKISDDAPIGYRFYVSAKYDNLNSKNYNFVVDQIAVTRVELFEQNGKIDVAPGDLLLLKTNVEPANATFTTPEFRIIQGSEWATVAYSGLVTIRDSAPVGATVRIQATVNGVASNEITFKVPATALVINAPNTQIAVGEIMVLGYNMLPTNNTLTPVTFRIVEGEEYAELTAGGTLTVKRDVSGTDVKIGIVAEVYGATSPVFYVSIKVPVQSVELFSAMTTGNVELGSSVLLSTNVYPEFATDQTVKYIVDRTDLVSLNGNVLEITDSVEAIGQVVEIVAVVDGVSSNVLRIRITKKSVVAVEFISETLEATVNIGGSVVLHAECIPGDATNNSVSYRIVSGMDIAVIEGDKLIISNNASLGSKIEVIASADGVDSTERFVVTVGKINVERVDLSVNDNVTALAPSATAKFSASFYPADATLSAITYSIVGEGRNFASINAVSGELTVNPLQLITRGDIIINVIATVDGVSSEPLSLPIIVPVIDITIADEDVIVATGGEIKLAATTNANATYKDVEFRILNNGSLLTSNGYGTIDGDVLRISENVFVPDATLQIVAIPANTATADVISNVRTVSVHVPVRNVSLMGSATTIMLGESAQLSVSIFPVFASNQSVTYQFVDNAGNIVYQPWGVTLAGNTVSISENAAMLTTTPRFMVCAFVDGVSSNVWRFDVIERPVTEIAFDANALSSIYNPNDTTLYEVNPNVDYGFIVSAAVNGDASFRGITFSAVTGKNSIIDITTSENQISDGYSYFVKLTILKSADIHEVITILAQSQRNPQIRTELQIRVTPIYADAIVGANVYSVSNRNEESQILDGAEFGGNLNGMSSNYLNAGDTVIFNNLYFDDEITCGYFKNVTFDDNFKLDYSSFDFITANADGKSFKVLSLDEIRKNISIENNSFTVTVTLEQLDGATLTYNLKFFIFVSVQTVQYLGGEDKSGEQISMTDGQRLKVNRYAETADGTVKNSFTFYFGINNDTYTTNRLMLVNNVVSEDVSDTESAYSIEVDGGEYIDGKTLPQLTFAIGEDEMFGTTYYNKIDIEFKDWYNVGTVFEICLYNPDHGVNRLLYSFTLNIDPVNESNEVRFGMDGKFQSGNVSKITSANELEKSYQVKYQEGPVAINDPLSNKTIKTYADLRVGYAVQIELGNEQRDFGQKWEFDEAISVTPDVNVHLINSGVGGFIIEAASSAEDSYRAGKLLKLVFHYIDGSQKIEDVVIYIRLVKLLGSGENHVLLGKDNNPRAIRTDLQKGIIFGADDTNKPWTYLEPDYVLGSQANAKIEDGKILVITNTNADIIANIRYNHKQFYNCNELTVFDNKQDTLKRRFIANEQQFMEMRDAPVDHYAYALLKDLDLSSYSNQLPLGNLNVDLIGNYHTISNINFNIGKSKLGEEVKQGLFKEIGKDVTVSNLTLANVNVSSGSQHKGSWYKFGALATVNKGIIENVNVTSGYFNVERKNSLIGGIVAQNDGTIKYCINYASLRVSGDAGGIAGCNNGTVESSYNYGDIKVAYKDDRSIGGVIGYNNASGRVTSCSQSGHISSENTIKDKVRLGAIIGHNMGGFDGRGSWGSFSVKYTASNGLFGWGAFDNGAYLFAAETYRVGKQEGWRI